MKQYMAKGNIVIGNGLGNHRFVASQSYTDRALEKAALTAKQIAMYFTTDKKFKK